MKILDEGILKKKFWETLRLRKFHGNATKFKNINGFDLGDVFVDNSRLSRKLACVK